MRYILVLIASIFFVSAHAQEGTLSVRIGTYGKILWETEKPWALEIGLNTFLEDPNIIIKQGSNVYTIEEYYVSVLPKTGELIGPVHVKKGENAQNIIKSLGNVSNTVASGSRVYIEMAKANCGLCTNPGMRNIPSVTLLIQ
ncbi:MAG: hypothetical protein H6551_05185 [Chitinophagales bacterium]|nr:hypothetical protein [Chitinophagaceae bacterium]MCB9064522.1 hypothetical protein [Chitinophagales bacterium]